jgi:hypothetical protein
MITIVTTSQYWGGGGTPIPNLAKKHFLKSRELGAKKFLLNLSGLNCEKKSPQKNHHSPLTEIMIVSCLYPSHNIVVQGKALLLEHLHPKTLNQLL